MNNRLYVGNLSWSTTEESLKESFEGYGPVESVSIITDRETGRSRGFGFVTFENEGDAENAKANLDGKEMDGRTIRVDVAHERKERGPQRNRSNRY